MGALLEKLTPKLSEAAHAALAKFHALLQQAAGGSGSGGDAAAAALAAGVEEVRQLGLQKGVSSAAAGGAPADS